MNNRWMALLVAALAASNTLAQQGQSTLNLFVNAYHDQQSFSQNSVPGTTLQSQLFAEDHTRSPASSSSVYGSDHFASAFGSVDAKQISLYSSARHVAWIDQGTYGVGGMASAYASVAVPFLMQQAALTGTMGTMVVPLRVTGAVSLDTGFYDPVTFANTNGRAWIGFSATSLGQHPDCSSVGNQCRDIASDFQGTVVRGSGVDGIWTLNIPFQFGSWAQYQISANTEVRVGGNAGWGQSVDHEGESDFSHTLKWGGISAVLDASGQPVLNWTVQSLPGIDLTTPVPEPSSWALMLAGLVLLGWLAQQQQRRATSPQHNRTTRQDPVST
ncbi:MAG TPA: PEP-CTERM sorting domain-containing protein [Burkholderiaceae bacterium]|mgnify:FL=1|nr:PEP-CTERM sorting domain-containing protein [Burkholderiaceae bacterium]